MTTAQKSCEVDTVEFNHRSRRMACILWPAFPLELFFKMRPALRQRPVVLTDDTAETAPVTACNDRAAHYDVTVGMTAAQANSLCPDLIVGLRDRQREQELMHRMARNLEQVGPDIETADGSIFLEASRLHRLYRDESGIARRILAVLRPFGYPVKIGFAANKFVARIAAEQARPNRWMVVPTGTEGSWLHQLHVDRLDLSEATVDILSDLGIVTIGQAAAMPSNEVIGRFGRDGLALARRSRGDDPELFSPQRPEDDYHGTMVLDYPIRAAGTLMYPIKKILGRLLTGLRRKGRAAVEVRITLTLDNHTESVFKIAVERPAAGTARFLRQIRSHLERLRLDAAVTDISLRIPQASTLLLEQTAFDHRTTTETIDRHTCETIHRNLDGTRLCTVELTPAGLPERTFNLRPVTPSNRRAATGQLLPDKPDSPPVPTYSFHRLAGLRLIHPPHPTEIHIDNYEQNRKEIADTVYDGSRTHRITRRHGPWKLSGDWWVSGFDRLYYELDTADSRRYLVFFDRASARWFLQGVYD